MAPLLRRCALLFGGCVVLGLGVALLLRAELGSDGYSSLASGLSISLGVDFWIVNLAVGVFFISIAMARGLMPGVGTLVQIVVVGATVSVGLSLIDSPEGPAARIALMAVAFPVLALGIATYLGSQTGAGPAEGAALAWDPPVPFKWSYSVVQGGGALVGWLLGAAVGPGTIATILLLGPLVDLTARLLSLDVHQRRKPSLARDEAGR